MTATVTDEVQQQVLAAVRKSQEITLDAIGKVVGAVSAVAGKLPASPLAERLPSLSALPGVSALPRPDAVVSGAFDFLDRLVAEQRHFAGELVKATSGLHPAAKADPAAEDPAAEDPAAQ